MTAVDAPAPNTDGGDTLPRRSPMRRRLRLINRKPKRGTVVILGVIPFLIIVGGYLVASALRRAENPQDKLMPSLEAMGRAIAQYAFTPEVRSGELTLWVDTAASLSRLGGGIAIAALLALTLGIAIGFLPQARATLAPVVAAISLIPPLAILPILFIIFGLGETAKVALIVIGIAPIMVRSVARSVAEIPQEQIIKAETLGATTWQLVTRVILPQALPHLVTATRLALGPAWLFLISAEAIQATSGLGYQIFLVRRYLAMDVILPYVAWITIIAWSIDLALRLLSARAFRWANGAGRSL